MKIYDVILIIITQTLLSVTPYRLRSGLALSEILVYLAPNHSSLACYFSRSFLAGKKTNEVKLIAVFRFALERSTQKLIEVRYENYALELAAQHSLFRKECIGVDRTAFVIMKIMCLR